MATKHAQCTERDRETERQRDRETERDEKQRERERDETPYMNACVQRRIEHRRRGVACNPRVEGSRPLG